jgi:hypothetical protein
VVDVQQGSLTLQGGGSLAGGFFTTNNAGATYLNSGNFNLNGAVTSSNVVQNGGYLVGANFIQGQFLCQDGNWGSANSVTIASNAIVMLAGGTDNLYLYSPLVITNYGTVAWSSGYPDGGGSPATLIYNYGLWDCQSDYTFKEDNGGSGTLINNYGAFRKSAGNDASQTTLSGATLIINYGKLDAQAGRLALQGGCNFTNGTVNFGLNSLTNYGKINVSGGAALSGTISVNLNNGYIPIHGNSFTNLHYDSFSGAFTNAVWPFADAWTTNYLPVYCVVSILNARPVYAGLATNVFTVNELTSLSVTNPANDLNVPAETLTYTLAAGVPGMTVSSATGVLSWTPPQTNSPSTNVVSVAVANNGAPPLSATNTFTVMVKEVNQPPTLGVIATQTLALLKLFAVTNRAGEPNIHSTTAGYLLVSPPAAASIGASGVINWTPSLGQNFTTNTITTVVTNTNPYDLVNPHLSATNNFVAIVHPNPGKTNLTLLLISPTNFSLTWPADHTGWRLESQTNPLAIGLGSNWAAVAGAAATNALNIPVGHTNGVVAFRMVYP